MALPWQTAVVQSIRHETPGTWRFLLQAAEQTSFDFKPGQFVTLDLPIHEKPARRMRSYSIASAPDGSNTFELIISHMPGGSGTDYLFSEVKPGSRLVFRGPQGVFTLPEPLNRDLFLICTGTGIAPFRAMARYLLSHAVPHREVYLLFGCRTKKDLLYYEEFRELEQKHASFHYLPVLSREVWEGPTGYIHEQYEKIVREKEQEKGRLEPAYFFLCGWKNMIVEAKQRITALGYDKKDIHQELYG